MSKAELEFEQRITTGRAAAFLDDIASGLRRGALELSAGGEKVRLSPANILKMELEASSGDDKQELSLKLKWHLAEVRAVAEPPELSVTSSAIESVDDVPAAG